MFSAVAVRRERSDKGVRTFFSMRQSLAEITDTAAPVSTSARTATPSTYTSITLAGEGRGLEHFDVDAVRASGTAAFSFPARWVRHGDASEKASDDVEMVSGG